MIHQQISLEGLPEPVARAIEVAVEMARQMSNIKRESSQPVPPLPVWDLGVKEPLTREAIYDDTD